MVVLHTFDGSEEQMRPTPGGRQCRSNKENRECEQTKKIRFSGGGLIPAAGR